MIPLCLKVIVDHVVDFFELGLIGSRRIDCPVYLIRILYVKKVHSFHLGLL